MPHSRGQGKRLARSQRRSQDGLSLISMIGVAAVIAILAAAIIPNVIRRIDQAARDREAQDLKTMADGLVQAVITEKRIPAVSDITSTIANYRALPLNQVTTNARRFARAILVNADIGGNTLQSTAYVQSNTVPTTGPSSVRAMFLSTLASPALPTINSADFNNIWNTPDGVVPAALGNRDVHDLKIERVDLARLFHRIHLHNMDGNPAGYTFNTNVSVTVPAVSTRTVYVLEGTALNLYRGTTTNLQFREIIIEDQSFVYQNGSWSRDLSSPKISNTLGPFGNLVAQFLNAGWNDPDAGARPQATIETFFNYMVEYIIWSRGDPDPTHGIIPWQGASSNAAPQYPYFKRLQNAQDQLSSVTQNLVD